MYIYASYPDFESANFVLYFSSIGKIKKPRAGFVDLQKAKDLYGENSCIIKISVNPEAQEDISENINEGMQMYAESDILECTLYSE